MQIYIFLHNCIANSILRALYPQFCPIGLPYFYLCSILLCTALSSKFFANHSLLRFKLFLRPYYVPLNYVNMWAQVEIGHSNFKKKRYSITLLKFSLTTMCFWTNYGLAKGYMLMSEITFFFFFTKGKKLLHNFSRNMSNNCLIFAWKDLIGKQSRLGFVIDMSRL